MGEVEIFSGGRRAGNDSRRVFGAGEGEVMGFIERNWTKSVQILAAPPDAHSDRCLSTSEES